MSQAPHRHLAAILDGQPSPESLGWLSAGLRRWLEQDADRALQLHRFLGLPGPRGCRAEMRRHHLALAAALLAAPTRWRRCQLLAEAARAFQVRRWPNWRGLDMPPLHASAVDCHLWRARQYGELAETPEAYLALLSED